MDVIPLSTLKANEQRRAQQLAIADAARSELAGAWLAVRPRRRRNEVLRIEGLGVDTTNDQAPSV